MSQLTPTARINAAVASATKEVQEFYGQGAIRHVTALLEALSAQRVDKLRTCVPEDLRTTQAELKLLDQLAAALRPGGAPPQNF